MCNRCAWSRPITSMKRSQLEFHRALPGLTILPHPVFLKEMPD